MYNNFFYCLERPLHTLPALGQIKSSVFQHFPRLVNNLGGNARAILERHGIDHRITENPEGVVEARAITDVFEHCASTLREPLFAIHLARHQEPEFMRCLTTLCGAAGNLREAMNAFIEYAPLLHAPIELIEGRQIAELRFRIRSDFTVNDQGCAYGLQLALKVLRGWGDALVPSYVSLPIEKYRAALPDMERALGTHVRVSRGWLCIAVPREALNLPMPGANRPLFLLLSGYMKRLKSSLGVSSIEEQVSSYIRGALDEGSVSIKACSKRLGMPIRTLQARLGADGLNFSDILERQRMERAKVLLADSHLPVGEIADLLGYSERTSFARAFKRWTRISPQQYRMNGTI